MAKKRRIRWDRVCGAALVLIILVFLIGFCVHSCTSKPEESSSSADSVSSLSDSVPTEESSAQSESLPEEQSSQGASTAAYQQITKTAGDVYSGSLILVNAENPCHLSAEEMQLIQVYYAEDNPNCYNISYPGMSQLSQSALTQFNRMMKAYYTEKSNQDVMFNYGYLEVGKEKSNPESSCGLDVQLHLKLSNGKYDFVTDTEPYSWLFSNMASYGFVQRYPEEKDTVTGVKDDFKGDIQALREAFRYVGTPHASYMTENNLCLEEYLQLLKSQYSFGTSMLSYETAGQSYQIYYVPASETGDTDVPVPPGSTYEISGNNLDGFIVSALMN